MFNNIDLTLVYGIAIAIFVLGFSGFVLCLKRKNIVTQEEIDLMIQTFGLTSLVIDELNLRNETKILEILKVVENSIQFASTLYKGDENIVDKAYEHAIGLCEDCGLKMNPNRELVIRTLIECGFQNKNMN